mgnify:CR=1 FL=1
MRIRIGRICACKILVKVCNGIAVQIAVGLVGIFLNIEGREQHGIVAKGEQAENLKKDGKNYRRLFPIVRPVMEVYPYAWLFFLPFILVTTFAVVNLLVGLIVNSMQDAHAEEEVAATGEYREEILRRLEAIEKKLDRS